MSVCVKGGGGVCVSPRPALPVRARVCVRPPCHGLVPHTSLPTILVKHFDDDDDNDDPHLARCRREIGTGHVEGASEEPRSNRW